MHHHQILPMIITTLVLCLNASRADEPYSGNTLPTVIYDRPSAHVSQALDRIVTIDFRATSLADVMAFVRDLAEIPVLLDRRGLDMEGIDPEEPITLRLTDVPLRVALNYTLAPLDLTWVIRDDVLFVTDAQQTAAKPVTRLYPIFDLVADIESRDELADWVIKQHIEAIQQTVQPDSWKENGGLGTIAYVPSAVALAISTDVKTHDEIRALLTMMREARGAASAWASKEEMNLAGVSATVAESMRDAEWEHVAAEEEAATRSFAYRREEAETLRAEREAELAELELRRAEREVGPHKRIDDVDADE